MKGYYLHSRKIFELYISRPEYLAVCEVILYNARFVPSVENGVEVKAGQVLIKIEEIADICRVSISQVRSALKRFALDGGITTQNMGKKGILITLLPEFSCVEKESPVKANTNTYRPASYKKYSPAPATSATYDIARAEELSRTRVPKLEKRK